MKIGWTRTVEGVGTITARTDIVGTVKATNRNGVATGARVVAGADVKPMLTSIFELAEIVPFLLPILPFSIEVIEFITLKLATKAAGLK